MQRISEHGVQGPNWYIYNTALTLKAPRTSGMEKSLNPGIMLGAGVFQTRQACCVHPISTIRLLVHGMFHDCTSHNMPILIAMCVSCGPTFR